MKQTFFKNIMLLAAFSQLSPQIFATRMCGVVWEKPFLKMFASNALYESGVNLTGLGINPVDPDRMAPLLILKGMLNDAIPIADSGRFESYMRIRNHLHRIEELHAEFSSKIGAIIGSITTGSMLSWNPSIVSDFYDAILRDVYQEGLGVLLSFRKEKDSINLETVDQIDFEVREKAKHYVTQLEKEQHLRKKFIEAMTIVRPSDLKFLSSLYEDRYKRGMELPFAGWENLYWIPMRAMELFLDSSSEWALLPMFASLQQIAQDIQTMMQSPWITLQELEPIVTKLNAVNDSSRIELVHNLNAFVRSRYFPRVRMHLSRLHLDGGLPSLSQPNFDLDGFRRWLAYVRVTKPSTESITALQTALKLLKQVESARKEESKASRTALGTADPSTPVVDQSQDVEPLNP